MARFEQVNFRLLLRHLAIKMLNVFPLALWFLFQATATQEIHSTDDGKVQPESLVWKRRQRRTTLRLSLQVLYPPLRGFEPSSAGIRPSIV